MLVNIGDYDEDGIKERQIEVTIHDQDVWSMDSTLAHVILPMLIKLKEKKQGSPLVDFLDCPDNLTPDEIPEYGSDEFIHARWDWVLDEMIWAFDFLSGDLKYNYGNPELLKWNARAQNGTALFGKYYRDLWS